MYGMIVKKSNADCRDNRMQDKTKIDAKFLNAFAILMYSKDLSQISVNEICKKANLSRRTFYNYYNSKEEFIDESILIILDEITKILYTDLYFETEILVKMLSYLYNNKNIILAFILYFPDIILIVNEYAKEIVLHSKKINKQKLREAYGIPPNFALNLYTTSMICTLFTGHPVRRVFSCVTVMSIS